jgi:hypothetical protein
MMTNLFTALLKLYPRRYREVFGGEMLTVFRQRIEECRPKRLPAFTLLLLLESLGILESATMEWIKKWTSSNYLAQATAKPPTGIPAEVLEAEQHLERTLHEMTNAIAHHKFQQARVFSAEEQIARENLRLLRERHHPTQAPAA